MSYVFLHGLGQTPSSWENIISASGLKEKAFCPDLPTLTSGGEVSYQSLYDALCRFLGELPKPLDLCGLSIGGMLALNYAIDHSGDVSSLVLIGVQYKSPKMLLKVQNVIFHLMPKSSFAETGFGKDEFISLSRSMEELDFSLGLGGISCPTLILCGEKDKANRAACVSLAQKMPQARFESIEGAGHEANIDAPEEFARRLMEFWSIKTAG